jgi:hypothetical protein
VQNDIWRAVCGVGAADMRRLCFAIATYLLCMGMGGGAGTRPVARLGGCGLCVGGLSHTSSVREATGATSRCVGGGCGRLPPLSPCFLISIYVMSARMCSGSNLMRWVWWDGVLTWWWGSFSVCFVCEMGLGVLCAESVQQICAVYVFR